MKDSDGISKTSISSELSAVPLNETAKAILRKYSKLPDGRQPMARRTFIGNLYKKVQDPNIVASLSGHVEGSRAFSRYREIDKEIKTNVVKLLDD